MITHGHGHVLTASPPERPEDPAGRRYRAGVTTAPLLTGRRLALARAVSVAVLGLLTFGVLVALVTYPSWQLALALVCLLPCPVILWVSMPTWIAPFAPGVPAGAYLRTFVPPVVVVALVTLGGLLLSVAPI